MADKLSLRTNANGDIYVYIEDTSGASLAFGADSANGVAALNTLATANVEPLASTANLTIDPTANGDIVLRPHGSGKTEFNTGDVNLSAGNLVLPTSITGLTEGAIFQNANRLLHTYGTNSVYCGIDAGNGTLTSATCINNAAFGNASMQALTTGAQNNAAFGFASLYTLNSGQFNTAIGGNAFDDLTTGNNNTGIGFGVGTNVSTGSDNILIGEGAGQFLGAASSSNIQIGNDGASESNTIRIGTQGAGAGQQNRAFMAGIHSVTPAGASQQLMIMDSLGQMGTTTGGAFTTNTYNTESGSAAPAAGAITLTGGNNIGTSGAGSTVTFVVDNIVGQTNGGASIVPFVATATGNIAQTPGGAVTMNTGTQSLSISSDASATTVAIATGAAVKTTTLGSTNSTSATTVQSGSGALNVTSTNGAMTLNSGTGALSISNDASATTVNLATGAAAKTVTLGSTNTTSSLALKYGTADFSLASATGNVMVAQDTGEITYPLQSSFLAYRSADVANVTGDGTVYTCTFDTEVFDRNSDYNNGTYTFTAPVTGLYRFDLNVGAGTLGAAHTIGLVQIVTTGRTFSSNYSSWGVARASNNIYMYETSVLTTMTAGDTATTNFQVYNSTKTVTFYGAAVNSWWSGNLVA